MAEKGTFVFRWPYPANDVHVTGTFDDWGKTVQLEKVGDHWEKEVELIHPTEAYFYKFVVDDVWQVDENAPKAGDGHWNTNNVLYPENIKRKPKPEPTASTPGAFPMTPGDEKTFSVQPLPASEGASNPISLPAGEKVPEHKDVTSNTIDSKVTTSKEDYEKAGEAPFPGTSTNEESAFSVAPIPASSTVGNPVSVPAGSQLPDHEQATGSTVGSNVTTSKEDYDNAGSRSLGLVAGVGAAGAASVAAAGVALESAFNKKPEKGETTIPESGLPMGGEKLAAHEPSPFLSSSGPGATTAALASSAPLEEKKEATVVGSANPFVSSFGSGATTAALASSAPLEEKRSATVADSGAASSVPEVVKESLVQSHQEPEAAASSEAVQEKSAMEKELLSKTQVSQASGEPASAAKMQSSFYGLATSVPAPVESSMQKAHAAPEAAAEPAVVAEKSAMEKELLAKVPTADEAGEPAPTIAAATSATAPTVTSAAPTAFTAAPVASTATPAVEEPSLAEEPAVKMMNQETLPEATAPVAASTVAPAATETPAATEGHSSTVPVITGVPTLASTGTIDQAKLGQEKHEGVATIGTGSVPAPTTSAAAANPAAESPSTPAKKVAASPSTTSSPANSQATTERKKKHRISTFIKKVLHKD